jgi:hypothetical protein
MVFGIEGLDQLVEVKDQCADTLQQLIGPLVQERQLLQQAPDVVGRQGRRGSGVACAAR